MKSLTEAKYIGGVGSILLLLTVVPEAGLFLFIAGIILVAIAAKRIADSVGDSSIFNNMLLGIILSIVGGAAGVAVGFALGLSSFFRIFSTPLLTGDFQFDFTDPELFQLLTELAVAVLAAIVVIWVFAIASSIFIRRSYASISKGLNAGLFSTVGLLYLIGAATSIILIGFVILFIAVIIQIIAFFTMPEELPQLAPQQT
ncbi:MAG: DUF996 domain-containing protein [Nitrososphaerota archaeon]|nr:DUF996 domain-containing protein [Candidatus Calditenuaceae archaeon]MDW8073267.1 DUF996 domain-containing protein [Nitrososphaerota archaeon]